jgi:hypothetical protein
LIKPLKFVVKCCLGLTFLTAVPVAVVYATNGWTWPAKINGVALTVAQFVITILLIDSALALLLSRVRGRIKVA